MLEPGQGETAVRLARRSIENCLEHGSKTEPPRDGVFQEKRGVFVTLNRQGELRGCIGYPYPHLPLGEAIVSAALGAALRDPRFPPLQKEELKEITVEVTVLTPPQPLNGKPAELPRLIRIGRDGLIVKKGYNQGLLLPQVAVEHRFDPEEFLCQTCLKAGLYPDEWLNGAEIYCFQGQIFQETQPNGKIIEKKLTC